MMTKDYDDVMERLEAYTAKKEEKPRALDPAELERSITNHRGMIDRQWPMPSPDTILKLAGEPAAMAEEHLRLSILLAGLEDEIARLEAITRRMEVGLDQLAARLRPQAEGAREKDREAWVKNHPEYREMLELLESHRSLLQLMKGRRTAYHNLIQGLRESLQTARALVRLGG